MITCLSHTKCSIIFIYLKVRKDYRNQFQFKLPYETNLSIVKKLRRIMGVNFGLSFLMKLIYALIKSIEGSWRSVLVQDFFKTNLSLVKFKCDETVNTFLLNLFMSI